MNLAHMSVNSITFCKHFLSPMSHQVYGHYLQGTMGVLQAKKDL